MFKREEYVSHMAQWSSHVALRGVTTKLLREEFVKRMAQSWRSNCAVLRDCETINQKGRIL
jgi:hypothetical protein